MTSISGVTTERQMLTSASENLKNFNIFEKNFRESEIIQKIKLKNILFQRYGQSINEQYIDQPQNLNKNNITPQPVRFTSSNQDYIIWVGGLLLGRNKKGVFHGWEIPN